jgi:hypothetical protein
LRKILGKNYGITIHVKEDNFYMIMIHSEEQFKTFIDIIAQDNDLYSLIYGCHNGVKEKLELSLSLGDLRENEYDDSGKLDPCTIVSYKIIVRDYHLFDIIVSELEKIQEPKM